jgi:peptide-methionine (S)-S-oxide reductase
VSYGELLRAFWESHDPTQGMRQGEDVGTQYRSAIYGSANGSWRRRGPRRRRTNGRWLRRASTAAITTDILAAPEFFFAEDYHQQYLAKNPGATAISPGQGVSCPAGPGSVARARG